MRASGSQRTSYRGFTCVHGPWPGCCTGKSFPAALGNTCARGQWLFKEQFWNKKTKASKHLENLRPRRNTPLAEQQHATSFARPEGEQPHGVHCAHVSVSHGNMLGRVHGTQLRKAAHDGTMAGWRRMTSCGRQLIRSSGAYYCVTLLHHQCWRRRPSPLGE